MGTLGERIRRLREARGWAQADLARRTKVTQAYVALLEAGRKRNPSQAIRERLARTLGVPVTQVTETRRRGPMKQRRVPMLVQLPGDKYVTFEAIKKDRVVMRAALTHATHRLEATIKGTGYDNDFHHALCTLVALGAPRSSILAAFEESMDKVMRDMSMP